MRRDQSGFTLIETLIATMIMMGTIVIVANTWSGNVSRVQKLKIQQRAALLLERLITETKIKYIKDKSQIPEEDSGPFDDIENYSWEIQTQPAEMGSVIELAAQGILADQGGDGGDAQNQEFTQLLINVLKEYLNQPDLIREIQYTVIYTKGKRQVRYRASGYLVNFDANMPSIPGLGNINPAGGGENSGGDQ